MAPTEESQYAAATPPAPPPPPHFVIIPLVAQGHTIPMVHLARLLSSRGARASLVTTPLNAARMRGVLAAEPDQVVEIVELPLPTDDVEGLPPGIEILDQVTDNDHFLPLFHALQRLAVPLEAYLRALAHRPSCIISDWCNAWTADVASRLGIPRLFFHGPSCFYSLCDVNALDHGLHDLMAMAADDQDQQDQDKRFAVPGMPVHVEVTKATAPGFLNSPGWEAFWKDSVEAMRSADGAVVNTYLDLEHQFVSCYEAALGKPVWTLGPLCLSSSTSRAHNTDAMEMEEVAEWLDAKETGSVVYVSFGSLVRRRPKQLFEVGHGLEDSGKPFLWVVKESEVSASPEVEEWLRALEERTAGRGLVVKGWAPQLAILAHGAVGGFVTHCGWNSLLESLAHGVPVVTWPHFADQFLNERLVVDVLGVGVPVVGGVTTAAPVMIFDDESAVAVARGDVVRAVAKLMGEGGEAEERRRKAKEYGEKARRAMEEGGSSYENLTQLIDSFRQCGGEKRLG